MKVHPRRFFALALLAAILQLGLPVLAAMHSHEHEAAAHHDDHDNNPVSESSKCPVCHLFASARNTESAAPTLSNVGDLAPAGDSFSVTDSALSVLPILRAQPRAPPIA